VRWGSDWTFDSGDWWTQYSSGDMSPVYRVPNPAPEGQADPFFYFWADALSSLFFPPIMDEEMQNKWLEPWTKTVYVD
jgi:hypothetical protein